MKPEFYLDTDKSTPNWTESLRLRTNSSLNNVGSQIATFNPYACYSRPGLMEKIVEILNKEIEEIL